MLLINYDVLLTDPRVSDVVNVKTKITKQTEKKNYFRSDRHQLAPKCPELGSKVSDSPTH